MTTQLFALGVCAILLVVGYKTATHIRQARADRAHIQDRLKRATERPGD